MPAPARRRPYAPRLPPAERRQQLLDAALSVIAEEGYGGVTIEAIARKAGVTRPVVYNLFDDLAELLGALLARQERRALGQIAAALPSDPGDADPDDVIVEGVRAFLTAVASDPDTWRPILLPPEGTPKVVRDRVARDRAATLGQLQALVGWGLEHRGGPAALDPELTARMLLVLGEDAGRLVLSDPERFTPERLAGFVAALLAGLAPR
jgi:AcrR family transcriptional regulator